jgi:hypothetical protein
MGWQSGSSGIEIDQNIELCATKDNIKKLEDKQHNGVRSLQVTYVIRQYIKSYYSIIEEK